MSRFWILKDGQPFPVDDIKEWVRWFETQERVLARDERDGVRISTVFLGIDSGFEGGSPVLWETMVFGGDHDGDMYRYCSQLAALVGHARVRAEIFKEMPSAIDLEIPPGV